MRDTDGNLVANTLKDYQVDSSSTLPTSKSARRTASRDPVGHNTRNNIVALTLLDAPQGWAPNMLFTFAATFGETKYASDWMKAIPKAPTNPSMVRPASHIFP